MISLLTSHPRRHLSHPSIPTTLAVATLTVLAGFSATVARGQSTAAGDPLVTARLVRPDTGPWKLPGLLAVEVEIGHPASLRQDTTQVWRMAPVGGWASAVRLVVTDSAGNEMAWPFSRSAANRDRPLAVTPLLPAVAGFSLSPLSTNLVVLDGTYLVRAEVECATGDGWRGRVLSKSIPLNVRPAPVYGLELDAAPVIDGPLVQGWPWGMRVELVRPFEDVSGSIRIAGGGRDWLTNLSWAVSGPDGRAVTWPWIVPELEPSDESWISAGNRSPEARYRLSASNTPAIPAGDYSVVARYSRSRTGSADLFWSGTLVSKPVTVRVVAPSAATSSPLEERLRRVAEDALDEAISLRNRSTGIGLTTEQRLAVTRQAAEPLFRAEAAALQWLLARSDSPGPPLLLSRIFLAQEDKPSARGWADAAITLEAAGRVAEAGQPTDPAHVPDPRLLAWRQRIDAYTADDRFQLHPTLQLALDIRRGGPVPADPRLQDEFFSQDPLGQWAATARASSEYGATGYSAMRATGPPDVRFAGDNANAWATRFADTAGEWIELTFARPERAVSVRIRQNFNPGAVSRVELVDSDGGVETVFSGIDTNAYPRGAIGWLTIPFAATSKPIERVRISLDSVRVRGWNEIDAVQLVAAPSVTVQAPRLVVLPPAPGSREITVADWPQGFRLERSANLVPPNWQPYAERPPAVISLGAPAEFFRLSEARLIQPSSPAVSAMPP